MLQRFSHYKLIDGTIEIDGIRMHQTSRKTPLEDAYDKVSMIPLKPTHIVLDICTGLGYNAIFASKVVKKVFTIENDPAVLSIAKDNTPSDELFTKENISIILANAEEVVDTFPAYFFDVVFHDPPRLKRAGNLYSEIFYSHIYNILKKGGYFFHYTGKPGSKSGKDIPSGVKRRLTNVGFKNIQWSESTLGFLSRKG